ncbi:MAG: putative MFS family arabinose efflux permease [Candidatus Promineifilaceae bacterium]|jgi:predicted MFS family arabinose efflux permease
MTHSTHTNTIRTALALSLGAAVALGFARFNYALLLPAMRQDLAWTYTQAGSMNTANALGYMIGALMSAPTGKRFGLASTFWVSMIGVGVAMLLTGFVSNFTLLLIFRLLAGFAGATTFIIGATLASQLAGNGRGGLIIGTYISGIGIGVFLASLGLPQLLEQDLTQWRTAWVVMGIVSIVFTFFARKAALSISPPQTQTKGGSTTFYSAKLIPATIGYFMFGFGYITYMTFVISLLRSSGVGSTGVTVFWFIFGVASMANAFIWSRLLDNAKGGQALAVVLAITAAGNVLPILSTSNFSIYLSAVLFGGAALTAVSAATNIMRKSLPVGGWAKGIALVTIIFSVGQTLGPLVSGYLADRSDSLTSGFVLSASVLFLGALIALLQKEVQVT